MTQYYYDLCCRHQGKVVTIYEKTGRVHVGRITSVDQQFVYLEPVSGHGVSGFHWGWGWGWGLGIPIALAAIGGFALGTAFFWI